MPLKSFESLHTPISSSAYVAAYSEAAVLKIRNIWRLTSRFYAVFSCVYCKIARQRVEGRACEPESRCGGVNLSDHQVALHNIPSVSIGRMPRHPMNGWRVEYLGSLLCSGPAVPENTGF